MTPPVTWVVGARGLLGSAVVRELNRRAEPVVCTPVPWGDPVAAVDALLEVSLRLAAAGQSWRLAWCAGAGVVGTSKEQLADELEVMRRFLNRIGEVIRETNTSPPESAFFASSAGGVYAGSSDPPFNEDTAPCAISPYGDTKLAAERAWATFASAGGVPLLVGRIANLYGPGQDMTKAQGLISQLCWAHLTRRPISIYVPLDTARDYLYVDDCARVLLGGMDSVHAAGGVTVKILASQRATTIGSILAELRRVTKRRPQVVLAANPLAQYQARDLRFTSTAMRSLDTLVATTLATGIHSTLESMVLDMQQARLPVGRP